MVTAVKEALFGKTLAELEAIVLELGMPRFTAKQLTDWLYKKQVDSIDRMTNLSAKNRAALAERFEIGASAPTAVRQSADGTRKYLFATAGGESVEAVYIPEAERATLCVSAQAGCRMGCRFCMTARMGFRHHLSAGQIVNQIRSVPEHDRLTNVVYMGMGEPLDNLAEVLKSLEILTSDWGYGWSPTRVTVSTIGVLPALKTFLEQSRAHLAVSLHDPLAEGRAAMMPAERTWPIAAVVDEIRRHDFSGQRRVSFEYILFAGVNDTPQHVKAFTRLTAGLRCRVNLIRWHAIPGADFPATDEEALTRFRDQLAARGVTVTIRASRGLEIEAACGMLSTLHRPSFPVNEQITEP